MILMSSTSDTYKNCKKFSIPWKDIHVHIPLAAKNKNMVRHNQGCITRFKSWHLCIVISVEAGSQVDWLLPYIHCNILNNGISLVQQFKRAHGTFFWFDDHYVQLCLMAILCQARYPPLILQVTLLNYLGTLSIDYDRFNVVRVAF